MTLLNRAWMTVSAAPGTGAITLGSAVSGFQTFVAAGATSGGTYSYVLEDGAAWEFGTGTYNSTGPTLTRTTIQGSSNSGSAISATSAATVKIAPLASDILLAAASSDVTAGTSVVLAVTPLALAGAGNVLRGVANTYTKHQGFGLVTLTDASSIAWDVSSAQAARVTLAGNMTLAAPTNAIAGFTYLLEVIQDTTGSRTLAFNSIYKHVGGTPTISTTANARDLLTYVYDGTYMIGVCSKAFA
jgi:hypothetical protein